MDLVDDAMLQMKGIIYRLVDESVQGSYYQKAIECLNEMRKGCISEDEAEVFNDFLYNIKEKYNKKDIWGCIIKEGLTLISNVESANSKVSIQNATHFLNVEHSQNI